MKISNKCLSVGPASSIQLNEAVYKLIEKGENPIILSYGEAPFVFDGLSLGSTDFNKGAHYSESMGILKLRKCISEFHSRRYASEIGPENIMITAGSKIASYISLLAILDAGEEILLHEPSWVSYQEHAKLSNCSVNFIPHNVSIRDFTSFINKNTRALILNNPNNPGGYLYTRDEISFCAEQCRLKKCYLIVDESYSEFTPAANFFSATSLIGDFDNVIVMNSISKNMGLSGWRIGYLISNPVFLSHALKLNQHLITCAPTVLQEFLADNFSAIESSVSEQMQVLMKKRLDVEKLLQKHQFKYLPGTSTFYFFIDLSGYAINAKDFCIDLLNTLHVAAIPGNAYGMDMSNFIRISIGVENLDRIESGLIKIKSFARGEG